MVSSFSTPGFPHVHAHPTRLPAMDAHLSAAIDSLVASMRADLRAIRDSNLVLCKAVDSTVAPIRRNLALLRRDLAFGVVGDSDPASMCSKQAESIEVGHQKPHDGDGSPLRISSVISIDSVPPLLSSSPLLRAMAVSPVKAHLNDSSASTIPSSVQGFVFPLRNTGTTKTAVPSPLADQHISDSINLEEYGDYRSFNSQIIHLCMLPSTHTNTTKHRHEVLTSLLSNFTNRKDKWYWILQFILPYYTGVIVIMYEDFLIDKCGWVNWYLVGKFVKKDFYALELFEKMSKKGSYDKMEISHWRDLYSFEITTHIWNPSGCTIIVELLVSKFQGISANFHQYATSGPPIWNELSQFKNVEFDHVAKEIENGGVRWISLPTAILLFEEMTARHLYDLVPISSATEAYLMNEISKNDVRHKNFSCPTNPVLSQEFAYYMGLELGWIVIKGFADEEIYVQLHESVRGCDVYLVQPACPPANEKFMEFLVMSGACRLNVGRRIHEYMLKMGLTENSQVTNAQLDFYAQSEDNIITGISYNAIKIAIKHWINFGTPLRTTVKSYFSSTNLAVCLSVPFSHAWVHLKTLLYALLNLNLSRSCNSNNVMTIPGFARTYSLLNSLILGTSFYSTFETSSMLSSCVKQPKFILCTCGYPLAFTPTYSTLILGTEPHSKRVQVTWEVQLDVFHGAIIGANKKHRYESCARVQTIPVQWVLCVQLHQHASPHPTIFYLEQLILKHGGAASAIESKAWVMESLQMGVKQQQNSRVNYKKSRLRSVMKSSAKEIVFYQHFQHALQGGIDKVAGDALAKAVKLILYFQYKEGKRLGAFENLFFRRELTLKCFDVDQRAVVAIELKTCLFTSVVLQVLMLHNWWSYASSLAPTFEPSTTLLLSTEEGLVQKPSPQAVLAQLISHLPSKNDKFTLRLQDSLIEFHCKQFQIPSANPNLEDKVIFQGKGNVMNLGFSDWLNHY